MNTSPKEEQIKKWLLSTNPLELFSEVDSINIIDIDPKPWSGHFNFLISINDKKFVFRTKGPEWGLPEGIINEYKNLKGVSEYNVGPQAYYLEENFGGEPAILEEYLDGKPLTEFDDTELEEKSDKITEFIYRLNQIPCEKEKFAFTNPLTSYSPSLEKISKRIKEIEIKFNVDLKKYSEQIESTLLKCEQILSKTLGQAGNSFIFESSHMGHSLETKDGFRFLNWEQVTYGDPSFTLAVFLSSIWERSNFEQIKEKMRQTYVKQSGLEDFPELLECRMNERKIANTIYVLWSKMRAPSSNLEDLRDDLEEMIKNLENIVTKN